MLRKRSFPFLSWKERNVYYRVEFQNVANYKVSLLKGDLEGFMFMETSLIRSGIAPCCSQPQAGKLFWKERNVYVELEIVTFDHG